MVNEHISVRIPPLVVLTFASSNVFAKASNLNIDGPLPILLVFRMILPGCGVLMMCYDVWLIRVVLKSSENEKKKIKIKK